MFRPVPAVIPFDNEDDALRLANSSSFRLGTGIWTKDMARVFRLTKACRPVLFG
jgi:aldehyde dehydrogenase (NAD+)